MSIELNRVIDADFNAVTPVSDTNMSGQIDQIAGALSLAQGELESAKKDQAGYGYTYSDLADVINTAKPVLTKYGLAVTQLVGTTTESVTVTTVLAHKSGQYFKSTASLPVVDMKGCNRAQGAGASLSYLRRYAYQAILGMASEDNDASSEAKSPTSNKPKKAETSNSFRRVKRSDNDEL